MHQHGNCHELFADLSAFIDEELDEERCRELSRHLGECEACRRYLESLAATRAAIRSTGQDPPIKGEEAGRLLGECLEAFKKRCLTGTSGT